MLLITGGYAHSTWLKEWSFSWSYLSLASTQPRLNIMPVSASSQRRATYPVQSQTEHFFFSFFSTFVTTPFTGSEISRDLKGSRITVTNGICLYIIVKGASETQCNKWTKSNMMCLLLLLLSSVELQYNVSTLYVTILSRTLAIFKITIIIIILLLKMSVDKDCGNILVNICLFVPTL